MDVGPVVLVVDDEPLILDLIQAALEDGGYSVRTASEGSQAIEDLQRKGASDIVGLITDVRLGKVDGWAVATRGREVNASLAVVYMTGDSSHDCGTSG